MPALQNILFCVYIQNPVSCLENEKNSEDILRLFLFLCRSKNSEVIKMKKIVRIDDLYSCHF
jgi:hypothetical protein